MAKPQKTMSVLTISPKQKAFLEAETPIVGFVGGRGSGKSVVGAIKILKTAMAGQSWMAVAPDYTQVSEATVPAFRDVCRMMGRLVNEREKPYPRFRFLTHDRGIAEVVFRSGDDPDQLVGPSKAGLWLDEASLMVEDVFNKAYPTLRYKGRMGQCFMTFTPRGRQHWTFTKFYEPCDEDDPSAIIIANTFYRKKKNATLIQSHSAENPFAPPEYVANIAAQYTELLQAQELRGEFIDMAGLLFHRENFKRLRFTEVPRDCLRVRYWDRAGTVTGDASAGVLMARTQNARPIPYIIEHVVKGHWSPQKRDDEMKKWAMLDAERYDNEVITWIEGEGTTGGKELGQQQVLMMAGYPVYIDQVGGTRFVQKGGLRLPGPAKVIRAMGAAAQAEAGNIGIVVDGGFSADSFLDEVVAFPESTYDDQVDAFSGAFNKLAGIGIFQASGQPQSYSEETASVAQKLYSYRQMSRRNG